MAENKNDHLVVAYFDSKDQAEQAADSLIDFADEDRQSRTTEDVC